jgi:hypothetical protein
MADIEHAMQLVLERRLIVKGGIAPIDRMANGGLEATLSAAVLRCAGH